MVEHVIVRLQWIVCRGAVVMIEFVIARLHWAVNVETVRWIVVEKFCISTSSTGLLMPRSRLTHVGYLHHAEQARCTGPHDAIRPCDSAARSAGRARLEACGAGNRRRGAQTVASRKERAALTVTSCTPHREVRVVCFCTAGGATVMQCGQPCILWAHAPCRWEKGRWVG